MRQWSSEALRCASSTWQLFASERGSATLEFLGLGVLLLVPISYGALTLVGLEQATLAAELAARNAARVLSVDPEHNESLAERHLELAFTDHGLDPADVSFAATCAPNPNCASRDADGQTITVTVRIPVTLPGLPTSGDTLAIPVVATATYPMATIPGLL